MKKIVLIVVIVVIIILGGLTYWQYKSASLISAKPSIKLIYPNGGESLERGSTYKIKWETRGIPATDKISITIRRVPPPPLATEGQEFDPIIFVNLANTGSIDWTVSDMYPDGNYILGINSYTSLPIIDAISDESDGVFHIEKSNIAAQTKYICEGNKTIEATLYKGETMPVRPGEPPIPSGSAKIILSDSRNFELPQTISADGTRYANADESLVFWSKGDGAIVLENGAEKNYINCVIAPSL
ncbi:MAG: MliC family protein [Patescibacteria group bacterium]|nr:MliC family protein [Patescibacteria group bacterium]MDD5120979.1 MliC family protein [Patescibacteria group bacterium]MDD5222261.1 MliC family protein [Patescibacteria group bacterium]MDD5396422.1 MliC family protein [Patescibacteria group bacterium]